MVAAVSQRPSLAETRTVKTVESLPSAQAHDHHAHWALVALVALVARVALVVRAARVALVVRVVILPCVAPAARVGPDRLARLMVAVGPDAYACAPLEFCEFVRRI